MICIRILPLNRVKCIEKENVKISEILSEISNFIEGGLIIVVNGRIIDNYEVVVSEKDEVLIVQEFIGG